MISAFSGFEYQLSFLCFMVSAGLLIAAIITSSDKD